MESYSVWTVLIKPCLQAVYLAVFVSPRLSGRVGEQLREHKEVERDISSHCEKHDSGMSL